DFGLDCPVESRVYLFFVTGAFAGVFRGIEKIWLKLIAKRPFNFYPFWEYRFRPRGPPRIQTRGMQDGPAGHFSGCEARGLIMMKGIAMKRIAALLVLVSA